MKSRRLVLTIEVDTDLTIAEISKVDRIAIGMDSHLGAVWIYREPGPGSGRLVQVQANAIKPEPKPADLIDTTQDGPHPAVSGGKRIRSMKATRIPRGKAKRAKGAK